MLSEPSELQPKWKWGIGLAFILAVGALAYRTYSVANVPGQPRETEWGMQDFRDAIYYPVVAFFNGDNPYDTQDYLPKYPVRQPFPLYSPLTLLLHAPLGLLPYTAAEVFYFALTVLLCVALARLSLRACELPSDIWRTLALATLILISRPGHKNLVLGQCTLEAVLFSLLALHYARRNPLLSGVALGLATFKPTFGVPLFLLMLCRRDWRACLYALSIGGGITVVLIGFLAAREGGLGPLLQLIPANNSAFEDLPGANPLTGYARIDLAALLSRFQGAIPSGEFELFTGATVLAICGIAVFRIGSTGKLIGAADLSGTLICVGILLAVYHQAYDLLLLTPAFVAVAANRERNLSVLDRRIVLVCFTILAANYLATATVIRWLDITGPAWTLTASINGLALVTILAISVGHALQNAPDRKATTTR